MKHILIVNINWLGDAIFSTPVFKAIKESYPDARLACLCPPRVKDVMALCPYVDKIIIYDEQHKHRWPWQKIKLIMRLRQEHFDAAVLLHRSLTRALLVYLAGIKNRVGFSKAKGLLTRVVALPLKDTHRADGYLQAVTGLGINPHPGVCQLRLNDNDIDAVEALLRARDLHEGKFIVFHPGGNWDLKRWPVASWVNLARRINERWQMPVLITGTEADKRLCQQIQQQAGVGCIVLAGQTRLGESLVIFKKAKALISGDSGPLHLANSVGGCVIGLFGPTKASITGPRGVGTQAIISHDTGCNKTPCYYLNCPANVCMTSITVDDVIKEIERVIAG